MTTNYTPTTYTTWTTTTTTVKCPTPNCGTEICYDTYNGINAYYGPVIRCSKCNAQMLGNSPFLTFPATITWTGLVGDHGTAVIGPNTTDFSISSTVTGAIPQGFFFTGPPKDDKK